MCEDCEEKKKETAYDPVGGLADPVGELADALLHIKVLRQEKQALVLKQGMLHQEKQRRDVWIGIAVLFLLSAYLILVWEVF